MERRGEPRAGIYDELGVILLNKYVEGFPHIVQLVDLSEGGMLVRRIHEPEPARDFYSIEVEVPKTKKRLWLWTRRVWSARNWEALRFVGIGARDRAVLKSLVTSTLSRQRTLNSIDTAALPADPYAFA
jgi:hypothetical protein